MAIVEQLWICSLHSRLFSHVFWKPTSILLMMVDSISRLYDLYFPFFFSDKSWVPTLEVESWLPGSLWSLVGDDTGAEYWYHWNVVGKDDCWLIFPASMKRTNWNSTGSMRNYNVWYERQVSYWNIDFLLKESAKVAKINLSFYTLEISCQIPGWFCAVCTLEERSRIAEYDRCSSGKRWQNWVKRG